MNKTVKGILIFVAGAGIGGVAAWFGTKNFYADKTNKEIQKVKNFYEENYVLITKFQHPVSFDMKPKDVTETPAPAAPKVMDGEKEMIEGYRKVLKNTPYHNPEAVKSEDYAEQEHPEEDDVSEPYPISVEEWSSPEPYFDKVTLMYERNGAGLIDAFTEANIEPGDTIGEKGYDIITDPRVANRSLVYIRNEKLGIDYEIEITDAGEDEEDELDE